MSPLPWVAASSNTQKKTSNYPSNVPHCPDCFASTCRRDTLSTFTLYTPWKTYSLVKAIFRAKRKYPNRQQSRVFYMVIIIRRCICVESKYLFPPTPFPLPPTFGFAFQVCRISHININNSSKLNILSKYVEFDSKHTLSTFAQTFYYR